MLTSYRGVLSRPGAAVFCGLGLLARLPMSMSGLGIVLLILSLPLKKWMHGVK